MKKIKLFISTSLIAAATAIAATTFTPEPARPEGNRAGRGETTDSLRQMVATVKSMMRPMTGKTAGNAYRSRQMPAKVAEAGEQLLYGGVLYADSWTINNAPFGIYTSTVSKPVDVQRHYIGDMFTVQGGGFYNEGKYYFINYEIRTFDGEEYVYTTLYENDAHPFKNTATYSLGMSNIARDLTFNPIEQKVYGIFSIGNLEASYLIGTMNLDTEHNNFSVNDLIYLDDTTNQVAIASDARGNVFTIGVDGNLYKLDKENLQLVKIGATGVRNIEIKYPQSATIDLETGKFYWAALKTDGSSTLYSVNPETGRATKIDNFPDNEEFAGIYMPVIPADGAPQAVPELFPTFEDGSLEGIVAFDAPKLSVGGSTLSGNLGYSLSINGEEKFTGEVRAGKRNEEIEMTLPANGWYTFTLRTSNSAGSSVPKSLRVFIGKDAPVACANPVAANKDRGGDISLKWGKPRRGVNGGFVDTLKLSYDVVRMPENVKIASAITDTICTDRVENPDLHAYWYVVTPSHEGIVGMPAATNKVIVGHIAQIPYVENFDTDVDFSTYTVVHKGTGTVTPGNSWGTWDYAAYSGGVAQCSAVDGHAKDEWLFTPPIHLEPTRTYHLTYKAQSQGNSIVPSFIEHMEVKMGDAPAVEAMVTTLVEDGAILNEYRKFLDYEATIHVEEAGEYHIGFHATTPGADLMWMLNLDDVEITPGAEVEGPARVTDLQIEALPKGELGAVISFKAPARTIANTALESIEKIEILRGDEVIKTFETPAPGEDMKYQDDGAVQGINRYTVVAYADGNRGLTDQKSVFVGCDLPGEPVDVVLKEVDGVPTVTWKKPGEVGPEGHYVDADALTYTVVRYFGVRDQKVVAEGIKELTFADTELSRPDQAPVTYVITAKNHLGEGEPVYSNSIFVGDALSVLPLRESFPNCASTSRLAYLSRSEGATWGVLDGDSDLGVAPYDNDGGMAVFALDTTDPAPEEGYPSMLYTDRFSLDGCTSPAVSFYVYFTPGSANLMKVMINPESEGWKEVYVAGPASAMKEGWNQVKVDLSEFVGRRFIQLGFRGVAYDAGYVFVDNILFDDMLDHNLQLASISAPAIMEIGQTVPVKVSVVNRGQTDAEDYKVIFYRNDVVVGELAGQRLAPGMTTESVLDFKADIECEQQNDIYAEISYAPDMKKSDNTSETVTVFVDLPRMAYVTDLDGELDGDDNVSLRWSVPDASTAQPEPVTDGFDSYEAFAIDNIGPWTVIDGDAQPTWGISSGVTGQILQYPHAGEAMAWQVFNPVQAGLSIDYNASSDPSGMSIPDWRPRSGSQMLGAFSPKTGSNDDWLISPELSGDIQLVKLYARSILNLYPETFEVLVSSKGSEREDFEVVGRYTVGMTWTSVAVVLPEGVRYIAVRCVSPNQFALMLDDITYAPAGAKPADAVLKGYNVYVDGTRITPTPVSGTNYTFKSDNKKRRYGVTAVYDIGESRMSNIINLGTVGVDEIEAGMATWNANAVAGAIILSGEAEKISVFNPDGQILWTGSLSGHRRISLNSGIYLVSAQGKTVKCRVR